MRSITTIRWKAILMALLVGANGQAQDVYNFYFQKAPGPQSVTQGADTTATEGAEEPGSDQAAETPSAPAQAQLPPPQGHGALETKAEAEVASKPNYPKWAIAVGVGVSDDQAVQARRTVVSVEHNFNKFFGLNAQILFGHSKGISVSGRERGVPSPEFALGAHVIPFRLSMFDYELIDFSFSGGVMSTRVVDGPTYREWPNFGSADSRFALSPYLGLGFAINISRNFALVSQGRWGSVEGASNGWGGVVYRF